MAGRISENLQREQARWLREWQRYIVKRHMKDAKTALEVGCGCGYIMENLKDILRITGIDESEKEVLCARERGFSAIKADGENIPYPDGYFDMVYGNYLLLWAREPLKIVKEMFRVSKRYVVFFAEPYWKGAIYKPSWLKKVVEYAMEIIRNEGGNPNFGVELGSLLKNFAEDFIIGTIPLYTTYKSIEEMIKFEVEFLRENGYEIDMGDVSLFYVPTFWGIVDKNY
ncbi:hypothetical protein B6U71_01135 [Euryarchaeota archaeon ex4484_178]|nr:MAG: hypothetical protein B6U71_01135 [Euryarchaeota archaeon ex4484_178]